MGSLLDYKVSVRWCAHNPDTLYSQQAQDWRPGVLGLVGGPKYIKPGAEDPGGINWRAVYTPTLIVSKVIRHLTGLLL